MTKEEHHKDKQYQELVVDSSSPSEDQTLREFCASVKYDEISLEEWNSHHSNLDLMYPLFVTEEQLSSTFEIRIRLSRTIRNTTPNGRTEKREKIEHTLTIKNGWTHGKHILLKGMGDRTDDRAGDLIVIVRVRS